MNKSIKYVLPIVISIVIWIIFYLFWKTFWSRPLSEDPAQWGQFWDYIWGLLNPIIGLVNLILLFYVYWTLEKQNSHREVMPLCLLTMSSQIDENRKHRSQEFKIKNCWFGPMIIENIVLKWPNNEIYRSFEEICGSLPKEIPYSFYNLSKNSIIDKGDEKILLGIYQKWWESLNLESISYLKDIQITINYKDVYGNSFTKKDTLDAN